MNLYDQLRHLADSHGLIGLLILFLGLCLVVFRPGARQHNREAARSIFAEDEIQERDDGR